MIEQLEEHFEVSRAEAEALRLLADGLTDDEIAGRLTISVAAIRSRLHEFYDRAGIHGRRAVAWAKGHVACCLAEPPRAA
ncbi:MAG: hypothetical protein HY875_03015 [Chloroflexi bacterium]|nr:hypothetical protein [Chloroflexota bacterium]